MNEQDKFEQLLAQSRPQADADFQRALEEKLVARLQERKIKMNGTLRIHEPMQTVYTPARRNIRPMQFSLTLAAAAVVVVLMAAIVLMMNNYSPEKSPGGASQQRVSATPSVTPSATSSPVPVDPANCSVQSWHPMYLTREGDTLEGIAQIFNLPVEALLTVNCMSADVELQDRMMIFVPITMPTPVGGVTRPDSMFMTVMPTIIPPDWTATPIPTATHTLVPTALPPTDANLVRVVMAMWDIPEGTVITEDMLAEALLPAEHRPENTFEYRSEIVGKIAAEDIDRWAVVEAEDIAD